MQRNPLGVGDPAKIYLAALLAIFVLVLPASFLKGDAYLFLAYAIPQFCYLGAILLFSRIKKLPLSDIVPTRKPVKPAAIALTLLVTAGLFCQNLILAVGFQWLLEALGIHAEVNVPDLTKTGNMLLAVLILCALPAIGEEFIFRGASLSSMRDRRGLTAALVSAAFFSLSHGNAAQLVHQFILGFLLAYITLQTGNIIYAVCAHFFNNLLAILLPVLLPAYNSLAVCNLQNALIMLGLCAAGILILYPSLKLLVRTAGGGRYQGLKTFFTEKSAYACYNDSVDSPPAALRSASGKAWLIALFAFLMLQLIINTLITAVPALNQLL